MSKLVSGFHINAGNGLKSDVITTGIRLAEKSLYAELLMLRVLFDREPRVSPTFRLMRSKRRGHQVVILLVAEVRSFHQESIRQFENQVCRLRLAQLALISAARSESDQRHSLLANDLTQDQLFYTKTVSLVAGRESIPLFDSVTRRVTMINGSLLSLSKVGAAHEEQQFHFKRRTKPGHFFNFPNSSGRT